MNTEKRKTYDERQKIGAWLWWVGPGLLVALAVIGYNADPFEDGIDLEPQTRAEVAVKTDEAPAKDPAADGEASPEEESSADDDAPRTGSAASPADDSGAAAD